ncbi:MAG: hypothetical protein GEU98_13055 [Pseudonocardiaceae bacterium]|nr:hypothetical protein [Pseudonocardiaceae bacterium]
MIGAGLFVGLGPAAAAGGWWLLGGLVLAALTVLLAARSVTTVGFDRGTRCLGVALRAVAGAALLGAAGVYVSPDRPALAGLGVLVVALAARASGVAVPATVVRVLVGVVLAGLAVFAVTCFVIEPAGRGAGDAGANAALGMLRGAGVLLVAFLGGRRPVRRRVGLALVAYLGVALAALYQLGPARLGLSAVPLHDALAAADASALRPMINVVVLLAVFAALYRLLGGMVADASALGVPGTATSLSIAGGLLVLVAGLLLGPSDALSLAGCLTLAGCGWLHVRAVRRQRASAAGGLLLAAAIAVAMPAGSLLAAAALLVVCAVIAGTASRRADRYGLPRE